MDRELEELVNELLSLERVYERDLYSRGMWDGAMMMIAYYDPKLFYNLFPAWLKAKTKLMININC